MLTAFVLHQGSGVEEENKAKYALSRIGVSAIATPGYVIILIKMFDKEICGVVIP